MDRCQKSYNSNGSYSWILCLSAAYLFPDARGDFPIEYINREGKSKGVNYCPFCGEKI